MGFTWFDWVLPRFSQFYWVLLGFTGFYWVFPRFYLVLLGLYFVLLRYIGFYVVTLFFKNEFLLVFFLGVTGVSLNLPGSTGFYRVFLDTQRDGNEGNGVKRFRSSNAPEETNTVSESLSTGLELDWSVISIACIANEDDPGGIDRMASRNRLGSFGSSRRKGWGGGTAFAQRPAKREPIIPLG